MAPAVAGSNPVIHPKLQLVVAVQLQFQLTVDSFVEATRRAASRRSAFQRGDARAAGVVVGVCRAARIRARRSQGARRRRQARRVCALLRSAAFPARPAHRQGDRRVVRAGHGRRSRLRHRRRRRGDRDPSRRRRRCASSASTRIRGRSTKRDSPTRRSAFTPMCAARMRRRTRFPADTSVIVAAFVVNELKDNDRAELLEEPIGSRNQEPEPTSPDHRADFAAHFAVVG